MFSTHAHAEFHSEHTLYTVRWQEWTASKSRSRFRLTSDLIKQPVFDDLRHQTMNGLHRVFAAVIKTYKRNAVSRRNT